jgi:hypothetical protein
VDGARYRALAGAFATQQAVGFRFGASASAYHSPPESFPTIFSPDDHPFDHGENQPKTTWQIGGPWQSDPGNYNSSAGQLLYVPDDPAAPGVDAVDFLEVGNSVVMEKPQLAWQSYGEGAPDQVTQDKGMLDAHGGPFRAAVAMARAATTDEWTQDAVIAFQDGTLVTTGTHASGGSSYTMTKLPAGLVPTAVALTTNNELALVTVWDPNAVRGGLAVVALGGPSTPGFWGDWQHVYPGFHNQGLFSFMKVLGVVWLDGMVAPTAVAAAADIRWPMVGAPSAADLDLSDEATRQRFATGGDLQVRKAKAGFALVMSRAEKKVAFVDLQPLFAFIDGMYFGARESFEKTQDVGQGPAQWPPTFDVAPESAPSVVRVVGFDGCPSSIATTINLFSPVNFVDRDDDRHARPPQSFDAHALIGTEDGVLHVYDVGGLHDDGAAEASAIHEVGHLSVGRNPTSIVPLGRGAFEFGNPVDYVVVSRGDRRVDFIHGDPSSPTLTIWKTLRDARLVDPISVEDVGSYGNHVPLVEVADFGGKQLVAYRYDKAELTFYNDAVIPLGGPGTDGFECGGVYQAKGGPLFASSTNVP